MKNKMCYVVAIVTNVNYRVQAVFDDKQTAEEYIKMKNKYNISEGTYRINEVPIYNKQYFFQSKKIRKYFFHIDSNGHTYPASIIEDMLSAVKKSNIKKNPVFDNVLSVSIHKIIPNHNQNADKVRNKFEDYLDELSKEIQSRLKNLCLRSNTEKLNFIEQFLKKKLNIKE